MFKGRLTLRAARAMRELTQMQAARKSGMSQAKYSLIEKGQWPSTPTERQKLAVVFGFAVNDIEWPVVAEEVAS